MGPMKTAKRLVSKAYQNRGETIFITKDLRCYIIYNHMRYRVYNLGLSDVKTYRTYGAACQAVLGILEDYKPEVHFMASTFK